MNEPAGNPFSVNYCIVNYTLSLGGGGTCICRLKHSDKHLRPYESERDLTCAFAVANFSGSSSNSTFI